MDKRTESQNLPAVVHTAQELVEQHQKAGDMIFVNPEDLKTNRLFLPIITVLRAVPDDFHFISGNFMPKSHQTDKISEAAGISFIAEQCSTRTEGEDKYVGRAQGRKRWPDGTWRTSQAHEYEFDVKVRSEEDFLNDQKKSQNEQKYGTEVERRKHYIELKKFARQRASTGARLKVIRELANIPISFKKSQIERAFVVGRVAVNTDELLRDPEMREAAIRIATGASEQLYGPAKEQKYITEREGEVAQTANYEVKNGEPEKPSVSVPWEEEQKHEESESERKNREMIDELRATREKLDKHLPAEAKGIIDDVLKQEKPDPATVSSLIDRMNNWETRYTVALRGVRK